MRTKWRHLLARLRPAPATCCWYHGGDQHGSRRSAVRAGGGRGRGGRQRLAPLAAPVAQGLSIDTSSGEAVQRLSAHAQQARERFGQELAAALMNLPRLEVPAR